MQLTLQAPAKINLSLRILRKREDGFHELTTRMAPVAVFDTITVEHLGEGDDVTLTCSDPNLTTGEDNLMIKAIRALHQATGRPCRWRMHLDKVIPSGAGLGGGSSDAAAVLRAANQLGGYNLPIDRLAQIAGSIGSDIPFFLYDSVCDATGRGESITPIDFPWKLRVLLIKPPFGIPTPWAYKNWAGSTPLPGVPYDPQVCPWGEMINDLERPVFQKHLLLPTLKTWLLKQPGVAAAMMSGSGATMFAMLNDKADGQALSQATREFCGDTTWVRLTETL